MSAFDKWFEKEGLKTDFYGEYTTSMRDCWDAAIKFVEVAPSASNNNRSDEIAWVEQAFDCYIRGMSDDYYKNIWNEHKNAVVAQLRVMR